VVSYSPREEVLASGENLRCATFAKRGKSSAIRGSPGRRPRYVSLKLGNEDSHPVGKIEADGLFLGPGVGIDRAGHERQHVTRMNGVTVTEPSAAVSVNFGAKLLEWAMFDFGRGTPVRSTGRAERRCCGPSGDELRGPARSGIRARA
jgi:hypothetical protein